MTVERLRDDLDYWIMIGVGDDIWMAPDHRPEFSDLVNLCKKRGVKKHRIPKMVLWMLKAECKRPKWKRRTHWHLVFLGMKKRFN